jgi:hypothetical protein
MSWIGFYHFADFMGFEFTGNFFIKQIVWEKKGEFFLKKLEKLVEFILEEEKDSPIFPDILAPKRINLKCQKNITATKPYNHCGLGQASTLTKRTN